MHSLRSSLASPTLSDVAGVPASRIRRRGRRLNPKISICEEGASPTRKSHLPGAGIDRFGKNRLANARRRGRRLHPIRDRFGLNRLANVRHLRTFLDERQECFNHLRVKMGATLLLNIFNGFLKAPRLAVGPVRGEGIPYIHNGENAGRKRY